MRPTNRNTIRFAIVYLLAFIFLFASLFPIIWIIEGSLKTPDQNRAIPPTWIFQPTLEAYKGIAPGLLKYFSNSLIVSSASVVLSLMIGLPAAYALARFNFKQSRSLTIWILSTKMAPGFAFVVPFYLIMRALNLLDTLIALTLVYLTFDLAFVVWIMQGFVEEIPVEIEEAAMLDGCTRLDVLRRITIPLVLPGVIVTATLGFVASWNEFLFAYVLTREAAVTIQPMIASRVSFYKIDWEQMCAYSTVAMLPVMVLSLSVRKYLTRGLTLGALKG